MNTFIDLFSGAGGFSSGFERNGKFKCIGAIDNVEICLETHKFNFPDAQTICSDIRNVKENIFNIENVDLILGSPPCQSFSTIGHSKINSLGKTTRERYDFNDYLFKDYFRFVKKLNPKVFVMENVQQFFTKNSGLILDSVLKEAKRLGYKCDYQVMNAVDWGVPQNRKRAIVIGSRDGSIKIPERNPSSQIWTVYDAIGDLPKITDDWKVDTMEYPKLKRLTEYQKKLRNSSGLVTNNRCRMSNERAKKVFLHMKEGDRYMDLPEKVRKILPFREDIFFDRLKRLRSDQPSWAVIAHIGMDGYMYIHPTEDRTLSVREAARIQSFHDDFHFCGNMREAYVQVGNAVPPVMAEHISKHIEAYLK